MKEKICNNCTHYIAYYKKCSEFYVRIKHGYCSKKEMPQIKTETCKCFKSNENKEILKKRKLLYVLEQALISLNNIAMILNEKEDSE